MPFSIEVEVEADGSVRAVNGETLRLRRAHLTWYSEEEIGWMRLSEASLARDWLQPEEDEAWAYLQPENQK